MLDLWRVWFESFVVPAYRCVSLELVCALWRPLSDGVKIYIPLFLSMKQFLGSFLFPILSRRTRMTPMV